MEIYARKVTMFDEQLVEDFVSEHKKNQEEISGDASLILKKSYQQIKNFYDWYRQIENLHQEIKLKKGQVGCTVYLALTKEKDELIGMFDIRHSLDFEGGKVYGHIGVDIRPTERNKGYYKAILKIVLSLAKEYDISEVTISCEYDNIASKKGIEHVFGKDYETIPKDGTYFLVYKKRLEKGD